MRAFSTLGDVFADPKVFSSSNSFLGVLGALEDSNPRAHGVSHHAEATI